MLVNRREALRNGNEREYEAIAMSMTQEEEMLVQSKLVQIIEKLGMTEQEFQMNMMYHGSDQSKSMQIMQIQQ